MPCSVDEVEQQAAKALTAKDFSVERCQTLLRAIPFPARTHVRRAQQHQEPARSITLGIYAHGNQVGLTLNTNRYPAICRYLNMFMRAGHPRENWTSLHVNCNSPVGLHKDNHNLKGTVNVTTSLGPFTGGELWLEISCEEAQHHPDVLWRTKDDGSQVPGVAVDTRNRPIAFCPKLSHAVLPWKGCRFSITAYTSRGLEHVPSQCVRALRDLNFPCVPHCKAVERPVGEPAWQCTTVERFDSEPVGFKGENAGFPPDLAQTQVFGSKMGVWAGKGRFPAVTGENTGFPPDLAQTQVFGSKMGVWAGKGRFPAEKADFNENGPVFSVTRAISQAEPLESTSIAAASSDTSLCVAVVVEEMPAASLQLQQHGWKVAHYHPSHVNSSGTAFLSQQLKSMQVQALWLDLPIPGRHVHKDRLSSYMTQLCVWLRLCRELGICAVLFGPRGKGWLSPAVQDLVVRGQLVKSYHRICAWSFKIDVLQTEPSSTCFVAACTPHGLPGHPCACSEPQSQHKLDWIADKQPHQRRLRAQMHAAVACKVAEQWLAQQLRPSTPDISKSSNGSATACTAVRRLPPTRAGPCEPFFPTADTQRAPESSAVSLAVPPHLPKSAAKASAATMKRANAPSQESDAFEPSRRAGAPDSHLSLSAQAASTEESAFPTDARIQQKAHLKALKEQGLKPRTRKVSVESHYDDCGTSMESLAEFLPNDVTVHPAHWTIYQHAQSLPPYWLLGSSAGPGLPPQPLSCHLVEGLEPGLKVVGDWPAGDSEICTLSGGHEDTALWCVRRRVAPGKYLEMVALIDPSDPKLRSGLQEYVLSSCPLVCVLLPTWAPDRPNPLTPACADIASAQKHHARHFLCEQPWTSHIGHSQGWWQFLQAPAHFYIDVADRAASYSFWASHAYLLRPLQNHPWSPESTETPKVWSNRLATSVMDGLSLLCAADQLTQAYPSVAAGPDAEPEQAQSEEPGSEWWRSCPGCRGRQNKYDDRHNRVPGQCRYPDVEALSWSCPGCRAHRPRGHPTHTLGPDCKHVIFAERKGQPRQGRHPRAPARKATDDISKELQAQLPDTSDLGAAEEDEAAAADPSSSSGAAASSSSAPPPQPAAEQDAPEEADSAAADAREHDGSAAPARRGPDQMPRARRTFREAGVGHEVPSDWSRFDISRSMRVLRVGNERAIRLELRKLHLRFWHASRQSLEQILKAAGVPQRILAYVPDIINTCHECRKWQRPGSDTQHALTASLKFNQHVEFDLLFYRSFVVCHLVCRATRWHAGCAIPSKEGEVLYENINTCWIGIHGPMQQLIADGETGLWSDAIAQRIKRQGIEMKLRAPQQHARYIERRGAILRATLHVMEEQLEREGLVYTFPALLAEAIFAGNALVHVGGSTPYQAVYGRQPAMLPPLEIPDMPERENVGEIGDRQRSYVREAALQAMIQATSLARINRAAHTRTSPDSTREFKEGDLVDVFRKPPSKDASGWSGPYRVTKSSPGQVQVLAGGHTRTYRSQDARLTLLVLYTANQPSAWPECMNVITEVLLALQPGQSVLYGFANSPTGGCALSKAARQTPQVLHALDFLFNNCWRLPETIGARLAHGAKSLSAVTLASHSTLIWWQANVDQDVQFSSLQGTKVNLLDLLGDSYSSSLVVQALHSADQDVTLADACDEASDLNHEASSETALPSSDTEPLSIHTPQGPLSAISEGSEHEGEAHAFLSSCPSDEPVLVEALRVLFALSESESLEASTEAFVDTHVPYFEPVEPTTATISDPYEHYRSAHVDADLYGSLDYHDPAGNRCVELWFTRGMAKVVGNDSGLGPDETYALRVYATGYRQAVIQRETDLLTPQDMLKHQPLVAAAALEELQTWNKYKCFKRVPRATAKNVMDSKFVAKWKMVKDAQGKENRVVRMRLALRGFKDMREGLENFAATGSRQSQRLLSSEVACHPGWKLVAVDVAKAFLQGMTYQEMSELTGEDEHEVHFDLPAREAEYLKQVPGFEGFDPRKETLKCLKPGTGCRDAPRAFALKLAQFTRSEAIGLRPSLYDSELELKHVGGHLVLLLVKHVDDIKIAGEPREVDTLVAHLESGFGKLAYQENTFTVCGLTHVRHSDGSIEMNQDAYLAAMRPIQHPELTGRASSEPCTPAVHGLFQSLLGAVAYSLLSQAWAAVFVVALQRHAAAPTNLHVRRLNLLLAALQKQKAKLIFPVMTCARRIVVFSDASFSKESDQKGYGMRGAVFLRMGSHKGQERCHFLEAHSQSLKLVTRSTFAAETLAAVGAVDSLTALLVTLQEVACGTLSTEAARALREQGRFAFQSELCIDAMNLYYALSATYPKLPAEKALFIHIAWLRDFIRVKIPGVVSWVDTRDMLADGLTKGKVERTALLKAMQGIINLMHPKISTP